jgi:hypothetical protein
MSEQVTVDLLKRFLDAFDRHVSFGGEPRRPSRLLASCSCRRRAYCISHRALYLTLGAGALLVTSLTTLVVAGCQPLHLSLLW